MTCALAKQQQNWTQFLLLLKQPFWGDRF